MKQALLVSSNQHIIGEFSSIATLANVELIVTAQPSTDELLGAERIFVDHETDLENLDSVNQHRLKNKRIETALVMAGAASARSWQVAADIGAQHIVLLPESRKWLVEYIKNIPQKTGQIVSVGSLTGGAGSTTVALAIARSAAMAGRSVTLIDLDFASIGLDIAAGCEKLPGLNWASIKDDAAEADGDAIIGALPEIANVRLLANGNLGSHPSKTLQTRIISEISANCDLVIIDAGRIRVPPTFPEVETAHNLYVTPNTIRACAIGREIFATQPDSSEQIIVREVPGSGLNPVMVAQTLNRPLAAVVPTDPRICELSEQGLALSSSPLSKFNRPISALTQRLFGEENVLRVA